MANKELRIKELCRSKGITLETLAQQLGIRRTSLAQAMSRNKFSIDKLADIADCLNCEIPDLFAGRSAKPAPSVCVCPHCGKEITVSISVKSGKEGLSENA